jgi:hypothetical protein
MNYLNLDIRPSVLMHRHMVNHLVIMHMTDFIAAIPEIDKQYGPFDAAVGIP